LLRAQLRKRKKLLNEIEQEIKKLPILGADLCVLTIATSIY
jgi:hypothetical protein